MKHQAMGLYKVFVNHDPEMTLSYFIVQQEFGGFSMDLVIGYKVFFLMDSCSIGIVCQESG